MKIVLIVLKSFIRWYLINGNHHSCSFCLKFDQSFNGKNNLVNFSMEFAVLELGLKNRQIFNVTSFLRIQVEAFKVNWEKLCSRLNEIDDEDCHSFFEDWEKVFSKILTILKANLHGSQSSEEKEFGRRLARIALQTSNSLLEVLSDKDSNRFISPSLDREKVYFINSLIAQINLIRNTVGAVIEPVIKVDETDNTKHDEDDIFRSWAEISKQQILINCVKDQCLPLGQYYILRKRKENLSWSSINETAYRVILNYLKANELKQVEDIINGLGFDHQYVIKYILEHTFTDKLRSLLVQRLKNDERLAYERLVLIEKVNEPFHLRLSLSCIKAGQANYHGELLTYGIFQENVTNRTACLKVVEPRQIWSYLVKTNRLNLLLMWIKRYFGNHKVNEFQDGSVFSAKISLQMIDELVNDGQDSLKESTLSALGNFGVFCSSEVVDMQLLIRRLFRSCPIEKTGVLTGFKDHPLFNKTTMVTYDQFHQRFIEYCAKTSLYQMLYWSYVQNEFQVNIEKCNIDSKLSSLLLRFKTWNEDPLKDYFTLNSVLEVARYLYNLESPVNLQSLLENDSGKLAILASQFAPKGTLSFLDASQEEIWFMRKESILPALEKHYPLLYLAMVSMKELNLPILPSQGSEFPSIYTLLKNTIYLDVSRLFSWQTTNHFRNSNDASILGEIPHFSHPKLVGLGLKANLTFIYHLKKGRPFEAFTRYMQNKTQRPSQKKIEIVCKRAALLSFYNCTSLEITSACITFLELFKLNSANLRLHLAVGYLIMSHAGKYLGLETKNQSIELGNLLRKAYYHSAKGAITHIMELLLTSFSRKYPERDCTMDECVEYQLAVSFSNHYKLELPLAFLNKCIECGDWLMFTVYSQFYEYPKDIICKQLTSFSGCIPEHLEKAFSSSMVTSERKSTQPIVRRRVTESRDTLYSRLGLLKSATAQRQAPTSVPLAVSPEDDRASVASETDLSCLETASIASSSMVGDLPESPDFDPESPPKDLFNLILTCQRYHPVEPGKSLLLASLALCNPIPALIAASLYPNSENESDYCTFDCFCCWLYSSFNLEDKFKSPPNSNSITWDQQDFNSMITGALQVANNFIIFFNGLRIFSGANNPLVDLIQFFIEFLVEKDYFGSVKKLKTFQECLWNYEKNQEARGLLSSKAWIEETSVIILSSGLKAADCDFELHILLRHLDFARLQSSFDQQTSVPDFRKLYRLSQCLLDTGLNLNISDLLDLQPETDEYLVSVIRVVHDLQDKGFYSEAHQFASISEIPKEKIFINEWRKKILKDENNFSLWKSCFIDLEKSQIDLSMLRSFIGEFRNSVDSELIKAFIQAKDFYYATRLECDPVETTINEIDLWRTVISLEMNSINPDELIDWTGIWENILEICKSIVPDDFDSKLPPIINEKARLNPQQTETLRVIIGKILNVGKIDLAYRLSHLFLVKSVDLLLINFCNLLADGFFAHICPKAYIETRSKDYDFQGLSEIVQMLDGFSSPSKVIKILDKCASYSLYAVDACQRIILYYKVSFVIERSYSDLAKERDEIAILADLIKKSASNGDALSYAKELITFAKIGDDQVSNLIMDEILPAIKEYLAQLESGSKHNSTENAGATNFLALIRLVNDPTILGRKFVEILRTDIPPLMAVEVCIKAHECFTLCCDIEGISLVLRNVRILVIQHLSSAKNHQAMIRLLTGIGRYSEMSYIFDILRENHQFELLLRRGNQKCNKLRVALLDYLKGDKEMYPLIALNFSMHREIAEMLESGAIKSFNAINLRRQQNCMAFKEELEKVLQELMDASESYKKAGVFNRSDYCDKMAQLVALQIHYLPSGIILINLTENSVADFITRHSKFIEALIVADAYQNHRQWNLAIFNNVVSRGDWTYLRDFNMAFPLNPNNLDEIYGLFVKFRANNKTLSSDKLSTMKANLHKLIKQSSDLVQVYKYSQELGFVEASNNLLKDINGAYLSDLRRQSNL